MNTLENECMAKAEELIRMGYVKDVDIFRLTDTLIALEKEKIEKNEKSDKLIDYNDEIVEIEDVGEVMTTDISTSGDNLFYCNGILTKNSFGLPATSDLMVALISTEQLEGMNQIMVKQLKNRYNDITQNKRFVVGIDRSKMRLYDVEDSAQTLSNDSQSKQEEERDFSSFNI
jgi:hypothetical protein